MIHSLRITKIKLLTNNPSKVHALCVPGLQCVSILPLAVQSNPCNRRYIKTKREKFNHYGFRPQPYYGISGIRRVADLRGAIIAAKHLSKGRESITVGIPCSAALLNSLLACEKIATLFRHARRAGLTPVLHFSFTKNYSAELRGIRQTMPFVKHLQLNDLPTPDLKTLEFATSHFHVVLPLSPKQVCAATRSFLQLIKRTGTTILLDKSKGKGKTQLVKEYLRQIQLLLNAGINTIALAGGFGSQTLKPYFSVLEYFRIPFSIDAESALMTEGKLDRRKVRDYLNILTTGSSSP